MKELPTQQNSCEIGNHAHLRPTLGGFRCPACKALIAAHGDVYTMFKHLLSRLDEADRQTRLVARALASLPNITCCDFCGRMEHDLAEQFITLAGLSMCATCILANPGLLKDDPEMYGGLVSEAAKWYAERARTKEGREQLKSPASVVRRMWEAIKATYPEAEEQGKAIVERLSR